MRQRLDGGGNVRGKHDRASRARFMSAAAFLRGRRRATTRHVGETLTAGVP